ncbi:unnamed protein product [Camellia sinensis]
MALANSQTLHDESHSRSSSPLLSLLISANLLHTDIHMHTPSLSRSETSMEAQLTKSTLTPFTTTDLHKAWHLLSLLLRIGRPSPPSELASQCILFPVPPDYINYLCSISNSPICFNNDLFVIPSLVVFVAFRKFLSNLNAIDAFVPRIGVGGFRVWEDVVRTYSRRRKRLRSEFEIMAVEKKRAVWCSVDEGNRIVPISTPSDYSKVQFPKGDNMTRGIDTRAGDISIMKLESDNLNRVVEKVPFSFNLNAGLLSYGLQKIDLETSKETSIIFDRLKEHRYVYKPECQHSFLSFENFPHILYPITVEKIKTCMLHPEQSIHTTEENLVVWRETKMDETSFRSRTSFNATSCTKVEEQSIISPVEAGNVGHAFKDKNIRIVADERVVDGKEQKLLIDSIFRKDEIEYVVPAVNTAEMVMSHDAKRMKKVRCIDMIPSLDRKKATANAENKSILSVGELSVMQKQLMKSSKSKTFQKDALYPKRQALCKALGNSKAVDSPIEQLQCTKDRNTIPMKQKLKQNCEQKMYTKKVENSKEKRDNPIAIALNEPKPLPNFESFTVEEEEGSGGYGTVYRAQRKNDRVTFAIKWKLQFLQSPHTNANRHHVHNEMKMLEHFGGKNFVIKYEGSFKSGNSECLVLEHVEHDRPEVLKREIDVFQLQWYGYCMFRALSGLHKQGIVHRDVKPGNFLFSRRANRGSAPKAWNYWYKSKVGYDVSFNRFPHPLDHSKTLPPSNHKYLIGKSLEAIVQDTGKVSKPLLLPRNLKKKVVDQTNAFSDLGNRNLMKSQGADGSGITSAKDATSTRTPSTERFREPIPCQGRKELISLVHKAMQNPNYESQSVPASKRKRIAAVPGKVNRKLVYLTPMPLYSSGIAVAGAGLVNNKGNGKQKREGPCVGTKGFRAPEVLFRSPHQAAKVDIWSAGVTLLYLMIGRTPFTGEPEQNIKEIAKLRGNEDLWEVAKLHNCESSFPLDLYDVKFLPSMKLRDWCKQNTKRPEFFEVIPRSLFDLVEKCLTVNPRLRISAEEALRHEFFTPCHDGLRNERLLRKGLSLDSGTSHFLHRQTDL